MRKILATLALLFPTLLYAQTLTTCNARQVAVGQYSQCNVTLSAAQLSRFDGTLGTELAVISAPGKNKAILPDQSKTWLEYAASYYSFSNFLQLRFAFGQNMLSCYELDADTTALTNQFAVAAQCDYGFASSVLVNQPLSIFTLSPLTGGNGSITLTIPFTVINVQ